MTQTHRATDDVSRPAPGARATPLVLVAALCLLLGFTGYGWWANRGTAAVDARAVTPRGSLSDAETSTVALFERASPSVVYITTQTARRDALNRTVEEVPRGTGSGFVWDTAGHVVTNAHVLQGASGAKVRLADQNTYAATLVGVAPDYDLAVLKIGAGAAELPPIAVGTSHDLRVGQSVFAIGNPFGLDQTLTTGVVSALGRRIAGLTGRPIDEVVQTDAAVNPGNSGGPLLDSAGRLIGVNTQIASPSGASAGIGFAVPVDTVNRIVPQLIRDGRVARPALGVQFIHPRNNAEVLGRYGLGGLLVFGVAPGSAAERAGLRPTMQAADGSIDLGDVIQKVDGRDVATLDDLYPALSKHDVGDTVSLTVWRDGKSVEVPVTLDAAGGQ